MLTEYSVATKMAIEICNNPELKGEMLSAPRLDCDVGKDDYWVDRKKQWDEMVEKKTAIIMENLGLAKELREKVMGIVLLIGMRMLTWTEYHGGTLGLSREYCINFLDASFITPQGIIDNRKAAEKLMEDENLNVKQKYKLACLYCFKECIPSLTKIMTKEDKNKFYHPQNPDFIKQPELVKFWSYYVMGDIDRLRGEKSLDQFRLEKAAESGSKAAIEFCLNKTKLVKKKNAIIYAAIETLKNKVKRDLAADGQILIENFINDWVVFQDDRYYDEDELWIPGHYYVDILYSLLSQMTGYQQVEFLKKDIRGLEWETKTYQCQKHSRVLEYFLDWPYQNCFLKAAELMWDFLPERSYARLLLKVTDKIESKKEALMYGEERSYDYRKLLKEFWQKSPEHCKKYVLRDKERNYENGIKYMLNEGVELIAKLFSLKTFIHEDWQTIQLILESATYMEKENIIVSKELKAACIELMNKASWEMLDEFVLSCFSSREKAYGFKRVLSFMEEAKDLCIHNIKNNKWNEAESFIRWSSLPETEMNTLKTEMIYSDIGKQACADSILCKGIGAGEKIFDWFFLSEEQIREFKKELIFSAAGIERCSILVEKDKIELVDVFANWCLSSPEELREFKRTLADLTGESICENLISDSTPEVVYDERGHLIRYTIKFNGGKWEEVEQFLTYCFSSEEEISDFKAETALTDSGEKIHFELIRANQWQEAETFFAWLELRPSDIKDLKMTTIYSYEPAIQFIKDLMLCSNEDKRFADYGGKQEAIELFLRWHLTDRKSVLEFKELSKNLCINENMTEEARKLHKEFDLAIAQRLNDIDEESQVKRKSENPSSTNKRLCNRELES